MSTLEKHNYDVIVIGAGGAGLRAAIEAREQGLRVAILCKSLFGKAHTVMAEGGIAASMGNVNSKDSWQVHFADSLRGGKFLNNPRMVELHAKEAPDRVWELETYGALFDRTPEGKISQRNFGGHEYPRLAHVGDRTGLELIRTFQQKVVSLQQEDLAEFGDAEARIKVFAELTVTELVKDGDAIAGAFGYYRETGAFVLFEAPAVILATGGIGKSFKVNSEVKAGRGTPHGGVYLDVSTRLSPEVIKKKLPAMYTQFLELADVDITATPFEVGPTCHYVMGGVEVDADTEGTAVPGLFACGEVSGGMHGANRLGGNSLSDLLVFGRRAGAGAVAYVAGLGDKRPAASEADLEAAGKAALAPFHADAQTRPADSPTPENPYTVHTELQQVMSDLVGIIRREGEIAEALQKLQGLRVRAKNAAVEGHRQFNPGWHLALDLRNMLDVSECIAKSALERHESRGGHTREDFPTMDPNWRGVNLVCRLTPGTDDIELSHKPVPTIRPDLLALFDRHELEKYMTAPELTVLDNPQTPSATSGEKA